MNAPIAEPAETMAELRRMKTDFQRLRILCALLFVMAALSLYQNFTTRHGLLDGRGNLNILDDVQMPRAVLHAEDLTSGLTLYDNQDQDRAMFVASQHGSGLTLRDVNASQRMIFRVNDSGSEIILADRERRVRFLLRVDEESSSIKLFDQEGRKTFDTGSGVVVAAGANSPSEPPSAAP